MVLLLAIDTSTTAITAAVHDGRSVLASATTSDSRAHGEQLAPRIDEVLHRAGVSPREVTDVACGLGPGPFTGLRVGIVTARTIAYAVGAQVHGLCSLDVLAHEAVQRAAAAGRALGRSPVLVTTDARRREVYWARYAAPADPQAGWPAALDPPTVTRPADLAAEVVALPAVGRGPMLYPDRLTAAIDGPLDVDAAWLADLAVRRLRAGERLAAGEPLYLRRPDAAPNVPAGVSA